MLRFRTVPYPIGKIIRARHVPLKEKDIFYLKLQWISAKDEAERKSLAEKIRQLMAEQRNSSK